MEANEGGGEGATWGGKVIIHHSLWTLDVGEGGAGDDMEQRNMGSLHTMRTHFNMLYWGFGLASLVTHTPFSFLPAPCDDDPDAALQWLKPPACAVSGTDGRWRLHERSRVSVCMCVCMLHIWGYMWGSKVTSLNLQWDYVCIQFWLANQLWIITPVQNEGWN